MADSVRKQVLDKLVTLLTALTSLKTIVVVNSLPDTAPYAKSEVPLAALKVESEVIDYETSRHGYWKMAITLAVYFLADESEYSSRETLSKAIKDKIGSNPTLDETCEMCEITRVESGGTYPLYEERFSLEASVERSIADA